MDLDKKQFKTITKYWNFYDKKDYVNKSFFNLLNKFIYSCFNVKITRKPNNIRPEQESFVSKNILKIRNEKLSIFLLKYFQSAGFKVKSHRILKIIEEFDEIFKNQPISNLNKGMGYNNSLIVFMLVKIISPRNIIESGVLRGYTTYLIHNSTKKSSKIFSYDINFSLLEFKSNKALYYHGDITDDKKVKNKNFDLAFFDDHVSHLDRVWFSLNKNIKNIILDDDVSIFTVHSDGWPPIPTVNMIFNYKTIPKKFNWIYRNNQANANINDIKISQILQNYKYIKFPNLFDYTGYKNSSETSILVRK